MIEVRELEKVYKGCGGYVHAVDGVTFSIAKGEFVIILGRSGSGKSTLLRILLGFETPESGAVYVDDQDLSQLDIEAVRRQVGVVLQAGRLLRGSICKNIVGSAGLTVADAWEAAVPAGLVSS